MTNLNWIDREIMREPESKFTMEQVFSEYTGAVRDYVLANLSDADKLTLGGEYIRELSDKEQAELAGLTDSEMLETLDWGEVIDWVLTGVSPRELGDSFGIDWTGLAESFGIR